MEEGNAAERANRDTGVLDVENKHATITKGFVVRDNGTYPPQITQDEIERRRKLRMERQQAERTKKGRKRKSRK